VHAGLGDKRDFDLGIFSPLSFNDLHPEMPFKRLGRGNGQEIISIMFIPARQEAVITSCALV
jgi:hypothetical protein